MLVLALLEGDFALVLLLDLVNFVFRLEDCWLAAQTVSFTSLEAIYKHVFALEVNDRKVRRRFAMVSQN